MSTQLRSETREELIEEGGVLAAPTHTKIGWQGVRFTLPPDWNLTSFSMERDSGYLRVDAPGDSALTVQVRWLNAAKPQNVRPTLYNLVTPHLRRLFRRPEPALQGPDLKANLEKLLKDTAKQAKKANAPFSSHTRPEKIEGVNGERTAINFTWIGAGRGQGKITHCSICNRVVVAQVVGLQKDQAATAQVAAQLFATLQDHSIDGFDRWALYDLQLDVPEGFRLDEQKLMSGYLLLKFVRGCEQIRFERWGLANMTLKKFTVAEWFRNQARVNLKSMTVDEQELEQGHTACHYAGKVSILFRLRNLIESRGGWRRPANRYEGGAWVCEESNKIYAIQVFHNHRNSDLWRDLTARCICHETGHVESATE